MSELNYMLSRQLTTLIWPIRHEEGVTTVSLTVEEGDTGTRLASSDGLEAFSSMHILITRSTGHLAAGSSKTIIHGIGGSNGVQTQATVVRDIRGKFAIKIKPEIKTLLELKAHSEENRKALRSKREDDE